MAMMSSAELLEMKPAWDSSGMVHEYMQSSRIGTMNLIMEFTRIACLKYEMLRNADYLITNGNVEGFEIVNKPMRVHFGSHSRSKIWEARGKKDPSRICI